MDDEIDEEKEVIEKKRQEKLARLKEDMVPIDNNIVDFIDPMIPEKVERQTTYATIPIPMYKFQVRYVESMRKYLGFKQKSTFMRYCILSFCLQQKKILDATEKSDKEFDIAYRKWRKKYIIEKYKIKERIEELNRMAPAQDSGDDPFTVEDLME